MADQNPDISKLIIEGKSYNIKDAAARRDLNTLKYSVDNTMINGQKISGRNISIDTSGAVIDYITNQQIDILFG